MTDSVSYDDFYKACCANDLSTARRTITPSIIDKTDADGNTALHKASAKGHIDIVHLLLQHQASQTIRNAAGKTAEDVASTKRIKELIKSNLQSTTDSAHFVAPVSFVEWFDTYENAYTTASENLEPMKRWLLQVPLTKLFHEILNGYIDKIPFRSEADKEKIKDYVQCVIEDEDPLGLVQVLTYPGFHFYNFLNYDLAKIGSNFRFLSTQNLFNSSYLDNEAPKDLGQHIFAAILINHPRFQPYYHIGTIYRGMNVTPDDLKEYEKGKIMMSCSFLSTSKNRDMAELFISYNDIDRPPVMCIYKIIQQRSSLAIAKISAIPTEDEVLIIPFVVFEVKEHRTVEIIKEGKTRRITEIELEECPSNVP